LAKLASGKQTAETGGGTLSPEIPVLRPESLSASKGDGHSGFPTLTVTSGSTPTVGEEEPRSKVARLSTSVSASGRVGCTQGQSFLSGEVTPLSPQEQGELDRLLSRYISSSARQPTDVRAVPGPPSRTAELPAAGRPGTSELSSASQAEVLRLAQLLTTSGPGRAEVVEGPSASATAFSARPEVTLSAQQATTSGSDPAGC
jgi:hypothetical protein